ncbi:MAG TPA: cytochrome c3 family protein [Candidatus Eisenbacteria bacterium]|nr:cytochrome c3 family protein [Candidatus Eisenbacteria bacterium]
MKRSASRGACRIAAALVVGAAPALMGWPLEVRAQFSPGPLASAHASIDKPTACFECHEPGKATTPAKCLACHKELAARISERAGYHGRSPSRSAKCGTCHVDHGGRENRLVVWPGGGRESFDHRETGYALEGAHARAECRECHKPALIKDQTVRAAKSLEVGSTYLGLSRSCAACHLDPHRGQFDAWIRAGDCASCHGTADWHHVAAIDHSKTRFPLLGKHAAVACASCHVRVDEKGQKVEASRRDVPVRYRPIPHAQCADCHRDPHKGQYGARCESCHAVAGWNTVSMGAFDHERTKYPLRGLHARVACVSCHATGRFRDPVRHARCVDCHEDRHEGQLASRPDKGDCGGCHTVSGFTRARFDLAEHERTAFPLRGAHRGVPCSACHKPTTADAPRGSVRFRVASGACTDCHRDPHAGQFEKSQGGGACVRCHTVDQWKVAAFDHGRTRFALEGAHAAVPCRGCHPTEIRQGRPVVRYRPLGTACKDCHAVEPKKGQRARA